LLNCWGERFIFHKMREKKGGTKRGFWLKPWGKDKEAGPEGEKHGNDREGGVNHRMRVDGVRDEMRAEDKRPWTGEKTLLGNSVEKGR